MHAVVDTNVWVSALLQPASPPGAVLRSVLAGTLVPVVCDTAMAEYGLVLARPRLRISPADATQLMGLLHLVAQWVPVPPYAGRPALPDPKDWPFIACALAVGCPVITGNLKHFPAGLGVQVLTARQWADAWPA